jgi:hypothetical protein
MILEAVRSQIDPILCLQAASQDDKAGVGYVRPICLDLALAIPAIFSGRSRSNLSSEAQLGTAQAATRMERHLG